MVVTTSYKPTPRQVERARAVALRCGVEYRKRCGRLQLMFEAEETDLIYVVTKRREELRAADAHTFVNRGMLNLKSLDGRTHPMLRAIAPPEAPPVARVVDATIGLASDALHLALVLGVTVEGIEASAPMCCLLDEGLERLGRDSEAWSEVTARVSVRHGLAKEVLEEMEDGSHPVVYFDPMFAKPMDAAPSFRVFRRIARADPLDDETLAEAVRVASDRVVVKVPHGARPTAQVTPTFNRRVCGRAVDYVVVEKRLPEPEWEHRRLPADAW